ncbi:hypothetical protein E2C01_094847 [Portunus trituberculatus]|uniref:Uncharacterized protein n=1 Tax=Portunus trituberculatus TaxID=210409 RepID=A0A5B7K492_PORTR|nr:hypothetical protein [Portunus trituberculatus]
MDQLKRFLIYWLERLESRLLVTQLHYACWSPSQPATLGIELRALQVGLRPHHTPHTGKAGPKPLKLHPIPFYW